MKKTIILIDNGHGCELEQEVWKDIPGWEGLYKVSNLGRIKSLARDYTICNVAVIHKPEKIMKQHLCNDGYKKVELNHSGTSVRYSVHRLVASAFIPNPENKPFIDHINTTRDDNRVINLRWVTTKENANNPLTIEKLSLVERVSGPNNPLFEEKSPDSKVVLQFDKSGNLIARYACCRQAMRKNKGYSFSCIARVCRGERMTYKGYVWKYETDYFI